MGGVAEDVVPQTEKRSDGSVVTVGKVRFHESGGEVHFHDDERGLKVAIPVATWWSTWQSLSSGAAKKAELVDASRKTMVTVKVSGKQVRDVSIRIRNVGLSSSFESLQKFSLR